MSNFFWSPLSLKLRLKLLEKKCDRLEKKLSKKRIYSGKNGRFTQDFVNNLLPECYNRFRSFIKEKRQEGYNSRDIEIIMYRICLDDCHIQGKVERKEME